MSEELLVQCCAPTLAGIKTGSLFSCPYQDRRSLNADIRTLNRLLSPCGLRILPLRFHKGQALLYLFRPDWLKRDLNCSPAREILDEAGYKGLCCGQCIVKLIERLQGSEGFPHEIGLFLSYPPEDVRGFIENKARNYKLIGYWKVYGDVEHARKTFEKYKKCTDAYCKRLKAGYPLDQLAVNI